MLQCRQLFISSWPASTLVFPQVAQARNMSIGEHRLALLRNIRNIRICMGKKLSFLYLPKKNERISIKKYLRY